MSQGEAREDLRRTRELEGSEVDPAVLTVPNGWIDPRRRLATSKRSGYSVRASAKVELRLASLDVADHDLPHFQL